MKTSQVEKIAEREDHSAAVRSLSLDERGELIIAACRAAAQIEQGRLASGLPPNQPVPWPQSTWALLRSYAPHGQQPAGD